MYLFKRVITDRDIDFFGHVNNATYLAILEEARWDLLKQNGYGIETVKSTGQGPVILEVTIKFKKEIFLHEEIEIHSKLISYEGKIGKIYQEIYNKEKRLCSSATLTFGLFDMNERRLIEPSGPWKQALKLG